MIIRWYETENRKLLKDYGHPTSRGFLLNKIKSYNFSLHNSCILTYFVDKKKQIRITICFYLCL